MKTRRVEHFPCIDPPYSSQKEATVAMYLNYEPGGDMREVWTCVDRHWHEGIAS